MTGRVAAVARVAVAVVARFARIDRAVAADRRRVGLHGPELGALRAIVCGEDDGIRTIAREAREARGERARLAGRDVAERSCSLRRSVADPWLAARAPLALPLSQELS